MAVLVKGVPHVVGGAALGAVAGDQEEGVLQALAESPDVGGVGGPGDGSGHGVAVLALGALGNALVQIAHDLVDQTVTGDDVLELPGAGIGGLDQDEGALVLLLGGLQEGLDGVGAHVAVEGHAVHVEGLEGLPLDLGPGQPAFGIGGGGGADVAPLDVGDDEHPLGLGVPDGALQHLHALPAQILVVGGLGLDGGDDVTQRVDEAHIELVNGLGGPLQPHAVLLESGLADVFGDILDAGVQPGDGGVFHGADLILKNVKRHSIQILSNLSRTGSGNFYAS